MKKILTAIMLFTMLFTMFAGVSVYAADTDTATSNAQLVANERTDVYALDYFKNIGRYGYSPDVIKQAQAITAGIKDDYAKVKAIHDWVANNIWYDYSYDAARGYVDGAMVYVVKITTSEGYANLTASLAQAAGFPAKVVSGYIVDEDSELGHAWAEVYVDGRWVFIDTRLDTRNSYSDGKFSKQTPCSSEYFDMSLAEYSQSHKIDAVSFKKLDADAWNGSLYFYDGETGKVLKEVKNFPLNGLVNDTYGFNINEIYEGNQNVISFTLNTMKVDSRNHNIWVKGPKPCNVVYYTQLDNEYKSVKPYVIKTEGTTQLSGETVPAGSKLTAPKAPTKAGYTFVGWYNGTVDDKDAKKWDYENDTVKENLQLYARFQKGSVSYTVTFNSNSGTAVKGVKVAANNTFTKPTDPTRKGYRFAGWYKDSKCTKSWNFATDTVIANTTLYADWIDVNAIIANPTTSNVLVDGSPIAFEAYNINGNNYFKLRDLAKVVSGTEKQFEVTWDGAKNAIKLISNKAYTVTGGELSKGDRKEKAATVSTATIYKDDQVINLTAYTINGNNYFKLRDVAQAFNIGVTWDGATNTVGIDTAIGYTK